MSCHPDEGGDLTIIVHSQTDVDEGDMTDSEYEISTQTTTNHLRNLYHDTFSDHDVDCCAIRSRCIFLRQDQRGECSDAYCELVG